MVYFKFTWKIENFSYFWQTLTPVKLYSPEFILTTAVKTKWRILITDEKPAELSYSQIPRNTKFIKVYLARIEDDGLLALHLYTEVELFQVDGTLFRPQKLGISNTHFKGTNACILYENINFKRSIAEILPKDVLIIRCKIWGTCASFLERGKCFAKTRASIESINFIAVIRKISNLKPGEKKLAQIQCVSALKPWFIALMFLSEGGQLFLILIFKNLTHLGYCRVLILDNFDNWEECGQYSEWGKTQSDCALPLTLNFNTVMNNQQHYLRNDMLTFKCEVGFYSTYVTPERIDEIKYETVSGNKTKSEKSPLTFMDNLLYFQKEGILCDVKLQTETQTFQAHKAVLSARSPVFKKMFTSNMKESASGFVDISDICADTLRSLLRFIYTDSIGPMKWQEALKLYFAADKYQIDSLKYKCSVFLKFNIQPSNCCDIILLSDMHQDANLKEFVQGYFVIWHKSVFQTKEWTTFKKNHIQLAADTMCVIFTSK